MIYQISNLKFSYNKKQPVLNNINLDVKEGELLCVLGKNGSGKTTLFNCLLKILKQYEGNILLNGVDIKKLNEKEIAKSVGYVTQNSDSTFNFTVFEYVLMGLAINVSIFSSPSKNDEQRVYEVLKEINILDLANRPFKELSGGEKQQVSIARALVKKPQILIFDEPTAHLDYANQLKVLRMIKELSLKGYGVIISTHNPDHAILLDGKVALLDGLGNIKVGTSNKLITEKNLKSIYGKELKIRYIEEFKRNVCIYPEL